MEENSQRKKAKPELVQETKLPSTTQYRRSPSVFQLHSLTDTLLSKDIKHGGLCGSGAQHHPLVTV